MSKFQHIESVSSALMPDPPSSQSQHYVSAASAANTRRAYRTDWADFTAWCAEAGRDALPATPVTVADYLAAHVADAALHRTGWLMGLDARRL